MFDSALPLALGLPQWASRAWEGTLYPPGTPSQDYLGYYAQVFDTVEGNTTFYALPDAQTVGRWRAQTPESFTFCFKLPQSVTHHGRLGQDRSSLTAFFQRLEPLGSRCGPFMIQLPARFGPAQLPDLLALFEQLPQGYAYSVEVRHPAFFAKGEAERALNRLLLERGVDRVCFDSRALFAGPAIGSGVEDARRKKPQLPVHAIATGQRPIVRFIGHLEWSWNATFAQPWLRKLPQWIGEGRRPLLMVHTPDNHRVAEQALTFFNTLADAQAWPTRTLPTLNGPLQGALL